MSAKNLEESPMAIWADAQQKVLAGWLDLVQETEEPSRKMVKNRAFLRSGKRISSRAIGTLKTSNIPFSKNAAIMGR